MPELQNSFFSLIYVYGLTTMFIIGYKLLYVFKKHPQLFLAKINIISETPTLNLGQCP